jgi:hypothetical protein
MLAGCRGFRLLSRHLFLTTRGDIPAQLPAHRAYVGNYLPQLKLRNPLTEGRHSVGRPFTMLSWTYSGLESYHQFGSIRAGRIPPPPWEWHPTQLYCSK